METKVMQLEGVIICAVEGSDPSCLPNVNSGGTSNVMDSWALAHGIGFRARPQTVAKLSSLTTQQAIQPMVLFT